MEEVVSVPVLDSQAMLFIQRFKEVENFYQSVWKPRYDQQIQFIKTAIALDKVDEIVDRVWKVRHNGINDVAQGGLGAAVIDSMRQQFEQLTLEIIQDSRPEKYEQLMSRMSGWRDQGLIEKLPKVLLGRAFATLHPATYHTLVAEDKQERVLKWFCEHTGFSSPLGSWAHKATALAKHLGAIEAFDGGEFEHNLFPWFVHEQLGSENDYLTFKSGHKPRPASTFVELPAAQRKIILRHNSLQTYLYGLLFNEYESCGASVGTELATGSGGFADAVVRFSDNRCFLYEIKVSATAADAVRQALGQLLEYAYRKPTFEIEKMFIVAEPLLDVETQQFLQTLNTRFGLTLEYLRLTLPNDDLIDG